MKYKNNSGKTNICEENFQLRASPDSRDLANKAKVNESPLNKYRSSQGVNNKCPVASKEQRRIEPKPQVTNIPLTILARFMVKGLFLMTRVQDRRDDLNLIASTIKKLRQIVFKGIFETPCSRSKNWIGTCVTFDASCEASYFRWIKKP